MNRVKQTLKQINKEFLFSIVIPIYNTEQYVGEAIDSIINQSIGFEKHIQLILVDDGSTDNTHSICKAYADKYKENITLLKQKNFGTSIAKNNGLKHVKGKYVNFMDSDDQLSRNALKEIDAFFLKHGSEVDLVSIKIMLFGDLNKEHMLNYKFYEDRVIDIKKDYQDVQLSFATTFVKREVAEKIEFDKRLKIGEDMKVTLGIIMEKGKYGVCSKPIYHYRKRLDGSSALQNSNNRETWYFDTTQLCHQELFKRSEELFGEVIPFIQYAVMYDLQYRLKAVDYGPLNKKQKIEYVEILKDLLGSIEDKVIWEQKYSTIEYKLFAISLKYNQSLENIRKEAVIKEGWLVIKGHKVQKIKKIKLVLSNINLKKDTLSIDTYLNTLVPYNKFEIYLEQDGKKEKLNLNTIAVSNRYSLSELIHEKKGFSIKINLKGLKNLKFIIKFKNNEEKEFAIQLKHSIGSQFILSESNIIRIQDNHISILNNTFLKSLKLELQFILKLARELEFNIIFYRLIYRTVKPFIKRPIWLFSDRITNAGDNGEAFFEYAVKQKDNYKKYFLLSKESLDYERMSKIGEVVNFGSFKHKILFLLADKFSSSHINRVFIDPFMDDKGYIKDLYTFDFIFLQHGIIKDDLSSWLNKYRKNIQIFVTSVKPEYYSIINGAYNYSSNEVKLTGLPRYDKLENRKKTDSKVILIAPTWREYLSLPMDNKGNIQYSTEFKQSEYFNFYNNLLNDKRILSALNKNNTIIHFCLHPAIIHQSVDFSRNEHIEIIDSNCNYKEEFNNANLLITDYSSVAFDFAYTRKPVLYTQFDKEKIFKEHIYKEGYFSYNKHGFGHVSYKYEETVKDVISSINSDFKLESKYKDRIDNFFEFNDKNNSKRVYDEILKLDD